MVETWEKDLRSQHQQSNRRSSKKKKINSRFGEVEINKSHRWSDGINGFQISPYLQELQAYAGQTDNYTASVSVLEKYLRIKVSRSQTERVTKYYAQRVAVFEEEESELQKSQEASAATLVKELAADDHVYAMMDGAMLQTREGESSNDWKEVKVGRIFSHNSLYALDKHHNWIKASIYSAHLGSSTAFLEKFEPLTDLLSSLETRLVFIADGAGWIWRWVIDNYPRATQILDYYHALEHLAKFAKLYCKDEEQRNKWMEQQKKALLNDQIHQVIEDLKRLSIKSKTVKTEQQNLLTYLQKNSIRMLYKTYLDKGYKIGSGAIESAHRTVIQKRLKQSGQRWTLKGAQNIIDLRLMNMNQQWNNVIDLIKQTECKTFVKTATSFKKAA